MKKSIIASFLLCFSLPALTCSELPGLRSKMLRSKATAGEILVSTMNRLGYGAHARSWLNKRTIENIERRFGKRVAVSLIAEELRAEFKKMSYRHYMPYRWSAGKHPNRIHINAFKPRHLVKEYRADLMESEDWRSSKVNGIFMGIQKRRKIMDAVNISKFNPQAKILDFWSNHFNVSSRKSQLLHNDYEYRLKRESCGTFASMLKMTAKHPAMLNYLDNRRNTRLIKNKKGEVRSNLNENYGREVVELHTLGTGPILRYDKKGRPVYAYYVGDAHQYDEVLEATKVLSGFRYDFQKFQTEFKDQLHEPGKKYFPKMFGRKVVIGQGYKESMRFLDLLARHWRTKWNICSKLVKSIYGFHPGRGTVRACSNAYGRRGNLKRMYESIILSDVFFNPKLFGRGVKAPMEAVIGGARALGTVIGNTSTYAEFQKTSRLIYGVTTLGRSLYDYGAPTGQFFDSKLLKSSTYVANRIDALKRIENGSNLKFWRFTGNDLENYATKRAQRLGRRRMVQDTYDIISPVFLNVQEKTLLWRNTKFFNRPDREWSTNRPIKSTVIRSYASGPGIRK